MTKIGATQPPRKLKLALLLGLSFLPRILSAQWHDSVINVWGDPPYIGYLNRSEGPPAYHLSFEFGLEQWEEGKRATHLYQLWALSCDSSRGKLPGPGTYCSLRREIFTDWKSLGGWRAKIWTYSSTDEDLEIGRADWEEGKLDFELVHAMRPDENIQVFIDMGYEGEGIYLSSFRAMNTRRHRPTGKVATIELKIPQYTYTLNLPIRMRGLQGRTTKLWDEMITTLSREDRAAWERIRREGDAFAVIGDDFWARTEVQGLIARGEGLPPEELEKVAGEFKRRFAGLAVETMVARFRTRLAESDMSAAGREGPEPEFASWAAICDGMKWPPAGSRLLTSRFGASSRHFSLLQKRILSMKRHRYEHDLGERWSWTHDEFDLLRNRTDSGPITT